jgi:DNA replication ATP-dependent helicase Dna2
MNEFAMDRSARLLKQLERLVLEEYATQREHIESQWSLPVAQRVRTGKAIEGLCLTGISDRTGRLIFTCQTNNSRFREGDYLFLHKSHPLLESVVECVLELDEETHLEMVPKSGNARRLLDDREGWIADEGFMDLSGYYLDALAEVADRQVGRTRILPLILGDIGPEVDLASYERGWEAAAEAGLNEQQAEAVAQAYATDLVYLVQGPPGTGKTLVLAHIARLLAAEGERVLVTALTHRAINNALNKIAHVAEDLPVCKVGQSARADGLEMDVPNYESFDRSDFGQISGGYIIGATPFATRTNRLSEVEFDTVLFDEASQITLPLAIMGMLVGKRYVFVGDDCQLPPVSSLPGRSPLSQDSIFSYLAGRGYDEMLTLTYRLNDRLTAWPSRTFYASRLRPAPAVGERRLELPAVPERWWEVLDPQQPAVFVDLYQRNTTVRSRREAETVTGLVLALLQAGISPEDIGVISPYRAQGREIRNLLRRLAPDRAVHRAIVVDTVERMQGQEREVILVSLATSSPMFAAELADFFFQPQRLNVTVTRPRTKLIIVGSSTVLRAQIENPEMAGWVRTFQDLLQSCTLCTVDYGEEQ